MKNKSKDSLLNSTLEETLSLQEEIKKLEQGKTNLLNKKKY